MEKLKSCLIFASGAAFMLAVLVVWVHCRLLPQQTNYENKLIQCEQELSGEITHQMNIAIREKTNE